MITKFCTILAAKSLLLLLVFGEIKTGTENENIFKDKKMIFEFPKLTGSYKVGTTTRHIIDQNRKEPHNPEAQRELMARVWYPAENKNQEFLSHYYKKGFRSAQLLNKHLGYHDDKDGFENVYTRALENVSPYKPTISCDNIFTWICWKCT